MRVNWMVVVDGGWWKSAAGSASACAGNGSIRSLHPSATNTIHHPAIYDRAAKLRYDRCAL